MNVLMIGKSPDIKCYYKNNKQNYIHFELSSHASFSTELLMNMNACVPYLQSSLIVWCSRVSLDLCKDKAL